MTAVAQFVSTLRAAGVRLAIVDGRLRVDAPAGLLSDADRAALRQHRDELVAVIAAEARPPAPADACLGCATQAWFWEPDWPEPGAGRWPCQTCSRRPVPSLHEVAAGLTADERRQLEAEAAAGNVLARLALASPAELPAGQVAEAVEDTVITVTRALAADGPGWVVVSSTVLGEEVLWLRDRAVDVPAEYAELPRFDRGDLAQLAAEPVAVYAEPMPTGAVCYSAPHGMLAPAAINALRRDRTAILAELDKERGYRTELAGGRLLLVHHDHRCRCGRHFECTAPSCAGKNILCVCCKLNEIEQRHADR